MYKEFKVVQLPSRHLLKEGEYYIEYSFKVEGGGRFSDQSYLWEDAFGVDEVFLDKNNTVVHIFDKSKYRAIKYTEADLKFIFSNLVSGSL